MTESRPHCRLKTQNTHTNPKWNVDGPKLTQNERMCVVGHQREGSREFPNVTIPNCTLRKNNINQMQPSELHSMPTRCNLPFLWAVDRPLADLVSLGQPR